MEVAAKSQAQFSHTFPLLKRVELSHSLASDASFLKSLKPMELHNSPQLAQHAMSPGPGENLANERRSMSSQNPDLQSDVVSSTPAVDSTLLAPLYKTLTSGANPLVVNVSSSCLPDPATAPREASDVTQPKLGNQEGFELDPSAANGYPTVAHLSADADTHHFLADNPIHASTLGEVVHKTRFSSEEPSIYSAEIYDSTPNSIIKLSYKYAHDDFGTLAAEP
ncbi:hypothetical protein Nepgr_027095 [Nepenthes gracilis]|uniref:Uncharacterized protein n=1 Tax=Nepenthes gracilis TaxID=150966 RepID=A0AAD3T9F0_NEPGR|nr:hypothetical protein Nepgr_027095 [Nepenthes gracilis]